MSTAEKQDISLAKGSRKEVEDVIAKAIKKMGVTKANDLCKYLPIKTGGYVHHFTFKKMRSSQPQELAMLIDRHILQVANPPVVAPKQRAPRGSRKRREHMNFTRSQLERMLNIARLAGDKEIITILSPQKSLVHCKKELTRSIRQGRVEPELWNSYVEAVQAMNPSETLSK